MLIMVILIADAEGIVNNWRGVGWGNGVTG